MWSIRSPCPWEVRQACRRIRRGHWRAPIPRASSNTAAAAISGNAQAWKFLREGTPWKEIVESAREWPADLIVVGTHGRSGLTRLLFGSTAEGVVRHARSPVVVVPPASATGEVH